MKINKYIDHTLLKPEATVAEIEKLCQEAKEYNFAAVCINPSYVKVAAEFLQNTDVKVCTVIGFPLGANTTEVKVLEIIDALKNGATEFDMVMNIGAFKSLNFELVEADMALCKKAAGKNILKVILETCLLTDDEIVHACEIAKNAGLDFVKTSTGFNKAGATWENVKTMKVVVGETMGVKAAGGVRTLKDVLEMIQSGATRIGTSGGVAIVQGQENGMEY